MTDIKTATLEQLEAEIERRKVRDAEADDVAARILEVCGLTLSAARFRVSRFPEAAKEVRAIMDEQRAIGAASREPKWITWGPDTTGYPERPVPQDAYCEVELRSGQISRAPSLFWDWNHRGPQSGADIVAYRVFP